MFYTSTHKYAYTHVRNMFNAGNVFEHPDHSTAVVVTSLGGTARISAKYPCEDVLCGAEPKGVAEPKLVADLNIYSSIIYHKHNILFL